MQVDWDVNAVVVTTRHGLADLDEKTEKRTATTGCGQGTVFGDLMDDIESIRLRRRHARRRGDALRAAQRRARARVDLQAGGRRARLRARARAPRSSPSSRTWAATTRSTRSPAGCGWRASTARDKIFYTTGRLTSEMVIKAAQMGIPVLVSRSGLTKMGHEIAQQVGITMIGRAVNKHYLLFTGRAAPGEPGHRSMPEPGRATARCHCGGVEIVATFPVALLRALLLPELPHARTPRASSPGSDSSARRCASPRARSCCATTCPRPARIAGSARRCGTRVAFESGHGRLGRRDPPAAGALRDPRGPRARDGNSFPRSAPTWAPFHDFPDD